MPHQTYILRLVTPGFLGDAAQRGEWRTPPLKAALRQWWRLLLFAQQAAKGKHPSMKALREREGETFGHAWLELDGGRKWFVRSPLRLALDRWVAGDLATVSEESKISHPEVPMQIGALLYAGYGPLIYQAKNTVLKAPPALEAGSAAKLSISWPARAGESLGKQVQWLALLLHWFGTIGGRSRNGWGSIQLFREDGSPVAHLDDARFLSSVSVDLERCMQQEWPHAIGKDATGPLVWRSKTRFDSWQEAMRAVSEIKIAFRTALDPGTPGSIAERHILAYPVTNHRVNAWGNQARLANQLRFKVHSVQGPKGKSAFLPMAFHLPHRLPQELEKLLPDGDRPKAAIQRQLQVWHKVHGILDGRMVRASFGPAAAAGGSHV